MVDQPSWFERNSKNQRWRIVAALVVYVGALLFRGVLNPFLGTDAVYVTFFPALLFSGWFCGLGPSLVFAAVSVMAEQYWLGFPLSSGPAPGTRALHVVAMVGGSLIMVLMGEKRRREEQKLVSAQGELEERVKQRTLELDSANQSLRDLSARLMQLQDDERRRIARELHDSVGQMLVGLTMNLASMRRSLEQINGIACQLSDSDALVQEMSKEVRTMSHLLHPPLLDEAGLSSALRWYIDGFSERSKIQVDLELPSHLERFSPELETAIFRVVQECLTNIHRHSQSPVAKVRITNSTHVVRVEVEDRGEGIPPEKQSAIASTGTPGVGIRGMRERIRQLGGTLKIDSDREGTIVIASLPVASHSSRVAAA
jgi:signal transduction histidine kinase